MQQCIAYLRRNKGFALVLVLQMVLLAALVAGLFGAPATLALAPQDFANEFADIAALREDGGSLQIWNDGSFQTDKEITFSTAGAALPSGAYEVTVNYFSCQTPDVPTFSVLQSAGSLRFSSAGNPSAVNADELTLDDGHRTVSTRLWVGFGARISDLTATLAYKEGQLYLYSIQLTEQPVYRLTRLLCFALFFAAVDFVYWLLFARVDAAGAARRRALRLPLALLGITAAACLPLFSNLLYYGHDLCYHLQRITAMAAELSYGQFPVRMATSTLNGYGYANPLCYCELFLTLPALLYNLWLPLRTCYQAYVFAVTLATCLCSYACFAKITASRRLGLLGAALYTLSAYRLVCVYFRAAVGEYTAISFLPLVLLGVYNLYTEEKPRFVHWAPLAFGMAALVQSHLISTELTAVFLLVFCLLRLRRTLRPARLLAWAKAAALSLGLSAWFLLPFLSTAVSLNLQVNNELVGKPQREGLYLMQLLNPLGPGFGGTFTGTTTDMSLTPGPALLLGLALALFCIARRECWTDRRPLAVLRSATGLGLLAVVLSLQVFPWDFAENWLGHTLAKFAATFQYPWRFLAFACLLFCTAALAALQLLQNWRPSTSRLAVLALAVCTAVGVIVFQMQLLPCSQASWNTISQNDTRDVGVGEYMIDGTSIYETIWAQPKPGSEDLTLTGYEKQNGVALVSVENAGGETDISLPIFNYGHYTASDTATGAPVTMTSGENMRVVLTIPAGYSGTIAVAWQSPALWRVFEVLSALCLLGSAAWALHLHRRAA